MACARLFLGERFDRAPHLDFGDPCPLDASKPDADRRPPNAFILFSRSARPSLQSEHPGLNNIEYTRILAQIWKTVPDEEKLVFRRQAAEMQNEFKLRNPHYTYKKVTKRGKSLDAPIVPREFRWEQMLNHHNDS
jgi:hypothetical protein